MPEKRDRTLNPTTKESRVETRRTMPGRNGGTLVVGGTKGGRTPDAWRQSLQALTDNEQVRKHLEKTLAKGPNGPDGGDYWKALEYCTEHGYGKAPQKTETAHSFREPLTVIVSKE